MTEFAGFKPELTQKKLKERLIYNRKTGVFTWKKSLSNSTFDGAEAGYLNKRGYIAITVSGKSYLAHRLVILYVDGYYPENGIDHIDRDKINNRRNNLREVSQLCNVINSKMNKNNKSGVTGVHFCKRGKVWTARIGVNYERLILGKTKDFSEAVKIRWEAEKKYKFPNCNTTSTAYLYLKNNNLLEEK